MQVTLLMDLNTFNVLFMKTRQITGKPWTFVYKSSSLKKRHLPEHRANQLFLVAGGAFRAPEPDGQVGTQALPCSPCL